MTEQTSTTVPAVLGVTERVARTLSAGCQIELACLAVVRKVERDWSDPETREHLMAQAAAVLAAVADAPGLEEALVAHRLNLDDEVELCLRGDWDDSAGGDYENHLADVVRAWLLGDLT